MSTRKAMSLFLVGYLVALCSISAFAQTTGGIAGTVKDPNGAVIAGAEVAVKGLATTEVRRQRHRADGFARHLPRERCS